MTAIPKLGLDSRKGHSFSPASLALEDSVQNAPNSAAPFTLAGMRRGAIRALPLLPGVFFYGATFGILAPGGNLDTFQAALMSAVVFSGSAQLVALALIAGQASFLAMIATILIVNSRYVLYGAALRPWLDGTSPIKAYGTLYFNGDANWILSMHAHDNGEQDVGFLFGSGMIMAVPWVLGTIAGALFGHLIANPAALGLDFFLVAFCTALGVGMVKGRGDLWTIAVAVLAALLANAFLPAGWTAVAAGLAGGVAAWMRYDALR